MAYDKQIIYDEVMEAIEANKLKHFSYIEGYIEPSLKTLKEWNWDKKECAEGTAIKRELNKNKISAKTTMTNKWELSDNPTLQIAAFKLIATDEERKSLSTTFNDHTSDGKELKGFTIEWGKNKIDV